MDLKRKGESQKRRRGKIINSQGIHSALLFWRGKEKERKEGFFSLQSEPPAVRRRSAYSLH